MPKRQTRIASPYGRDAEPAAGLHDPVRAHTYMFDDFRVPDGGRQVRISIGRRKRCDIRVGDDCSSRVHVVLERQSDGSMVLHDAGSTNGVHVDGQRADEPIGLAVGMRLRLGHARLYAVDHDRLFPIVAKTVDDLLQQAGEIYGNNTLAGKRIGRSRETVRKRRTVGPKATNPEEDEA